MVTPLKPDAGRFIGGEIAKSRAGIEALDDPKYINALTVVANIVVDSLKAEGKVFFCGNGGSAADSQHLAAELVGRQNYDRSPAAGIALTVDTSALTAIGNDYGFDLVFSRQVEALARSGDVLFGLSTSGRSVNVVRAFEAANRLGVTTIAMTGSELRSMNIANVHLNVPATETAKIQELHITCGHIVFALVERTLFPRG